MSNASTDIQIKRIHADLAEMYAAKALESIGKPKLSIVDSDVPVKQGRSVPQRI